MFSDIVFWAGIHRFVQLAAAHQNSPIYQYFLSYKSNNSYADLVLGLDSDALGLEVCHADDLFHLFTNSLYDLSYTATDLQTRDHFLTWWTGREGAHVTSLTAIQPNLF